MHHLSIDLETYSSVPIAKAGAQKYISSPDFEILKSCCLLIAWMVPLSKSLTWPRGNSYPRGLSILSPVRSTSSTLTTLPLNGDASQSLLVICRRSSGAAPCSTASTAAIRRAWMPRDGR